MEILKLLFEERMFVFIPLTLWVFFLQSFLFSKGGLFDFQSFFVGGRA